MTQQDWQNSGARLPSTWVAEIRALSHELLGKRSLQQYVWCVAAEALLSMPREQILREALRCQMEASQDWEAYEQKCYALMESAERGTAGAKGTRDPSPKKGGREGRGASQGRQEGVGPRPDVAFGKRVVQRARGKPGKGRSRGA